MCMFKELTGRTLFLTQDESRRLLAVLPAHLATASWFAPSDARPKMRPHEFGYLAIAMRKHAATGC